MDKPINSQILLPQYGGIQEANVIGNSIMADGYTVGIVNYNPPIDTCVHQVHFDDGHVQAYSNNIIYEQLYSQVDSEGLNCLHMTWIVN